MSKTDTPDPRGDLAEKAAKEVKRLRDGIKAMLEGNYDNPRKYRPGQCPHSVFYWEACEACNDAWLEGLLIAGESQEMTARWVMEDLHRAGFRVVPLEPTPATNKDDQRYEGEEFMEFLVIIVVLFGLVIYGCSLGSGW